MGTATVRDIEGFDEARPPTRAPLSLRAPQLFVIFAVEAMAIDWASRSADMSFDRFAFFDYGANLTVQSLTSSGYRPAIDFGYTYGLLAALIGKAWFWCMGLTPSAYQWAMVTAGFLFAWALARIFDGKKIGAAGLMLLVGSFGFAFQSSYPNFAHCIEAVLLTHALAEQVRGSKRNALALATIAVFAKPSMGYVYGALLLLLIVLELRRRGGKIRVFIATVTPAAIISVFLSIVLIAVYGARSFFVTIVPIEGATAYRAVHFGFIHGPGRYLWSPDRGMPAYILDIPGFWMASTWYLIVAAIVQAARCSRRKVMPRTGEVIITCALLHLSFVFLFFGSQASWLYYSYLLAIGCGLATEMGDGWLLAAVPLSVVALLSCLTTADFIQSQWKTTSPSPETAGLWALPGEAAEWKKVVEMARQERMVVASDRGGIQLMFSEFGKPTSLFLMPGLMTEGDVARKAEQISSSSAFVVPTMARKFRLMPEAPEIKAAMKGFSLEWKGNFFEVYRRRGDKPHELRSK